MAIHLIRHAHAGSRSRWPGVDEARPLSTRGSAQAQAIGAALADSGVDRLWASPYLRCVQTLSPLAERLGLEIEPVPALAEGEAGTAALDALLAAASAGHTVAACSHGDVIPSLVAEAQRRGARLIGTAAPRKGARYELWTSGGRIDRIVHIPTPSLSGAPGAR